MITHEQISKRAREIWQREGQPEGRDKDHWLQAEAELRQEYDKSEARPQANAQEHAMAKMSNDTNGQENSRKRSARRGRELH